MSTLMRLPIVSACSATSCGYNHHGCHAAAITIAPASEHAHCATYIDTADKAASEDVAAVGACSRADCVHNDHLACGAGSIEVGVSTDGADCLTYAVA